VSRGVAAAALAAAAAIAALGGAGPAASAENSVTISGRAYAFNHMDTFLSGATIRVREFPALAATTDANGDYSLDVPNDANVTPYIEPPAGYNQIDLQTFHTRGQPIVNANFQTPGDAEYNGLAALLSVPFGADGRPEQCVIVTTASARNVRGVDYETFHERTPHGVAGATARTIPAVPGPVYFNESVIPDRTKTETSGDGGIIWTEVPAGSYRVVTESPSTRFASFLATCAPGRVVNANPPWGAYQLTGYEEPLPSGIVAGGIEKAKAKRDGKRYVASLKVKAAEPLELKVTLRQHNQRVGSQKQTHAAVGKHKVRVRLPREAKPGSAELAVVLTDGAEESVKNRVRLRLPGE